MSPTRRSFLLNAWRRVLPRSFLGKAVVIGVPVLLVLLFLSPVVSALRLVVEFVAAIAAPILGDPTGRLIAVCGSLVLASYVGFRLLRDRLRSLRAGLVLRRHLDALAAWLRDDPRRASELWRRIARGTAPLPPEYRSVREDACLKLARLALLADAPGEAMAWVLRVREPGLPPSLLRAHAQLRARAVVAMPESLPESCRRELEAALARFPDDLVLLRLLRDRLRADGALRAAAEVQERVWRAAEPVRAPSERDALAQAWLAAAAAALQRDAVTEAEACLARASDVDALAANASGLEGDLRLQQQDLTAALRAYAKVPGSSGLARAAAALDAAAEPMSPRAILECCPTEGGLLLAARAYARAGDVRRARRAAQQAAKLLGPSPTVSAVLAEVLRLTGDPGAATFADEAVLRLTQPT